MIESHLGKIESNPGMIENHLGKIETYPGMIESHPGKIESDPGMIESNLGAMDGFQDIKKPGADLSDTQPEYREKVIGWMMGDLGLVSCRRYWLLPMKMRAPGLTRAAGMEAVTPQPRRAGARSNSGQPGCRPPDSDRELRLVARYAKSSNH